MAIVRGLTIEQVREQVEILRSGWGGGNLDIGIDHPTRAPKAVRVMVRVLDSRGLWARRAASGRHGPWACWHVWGHLFDRLLLAGATSIQSGPFTYRCMGDNWQDWNCGSQVRPVFMSECCDCAESPWMGA
jgi:hypothetical protein